jgi:hypothetical protein
MDDKIKGGYLIIPRIMYREWDIMKSPPVDRELFMYCLANVMFKDYGNLKRGQGYFQMKKIQEDLCWYVGYRRLMYSKDQLTKALRRLKKLGMTTTTKATRGVLITICNYDYYQDTINYEGISEGNENYLRRLRTSFSKKNTGENTGNYKNKGIRRPGEKFSFEGDEMNYSEKL